MGPRKPVHSLVALNLALLIVLALVAFAPASGRAIAQQAQQRGRGDYTMIGSEFQGGNANAIVILDAANREMIALRWNDSRKELEGIGYRDLAADAALGARPMR